MPHSENRLPFFVYGTLRPGEKNYRALLQGRTLLALPAQVKGRLYFVRNGGYPFLTPGAGRVRGEVIVPHPAHYEQVVRDLDGLEQYFPRHETASIYLRRPAVAELEDGQRLAVWAYYWNKSKIHGEPVPEGDFRIFRQTRFSEK